MVEPVPAGGGEPGPAESVGASRADEGGRRAWPRDGGACMLLSTSAGARARAGGSETGLPADPETGTETLTAGLGSNKVRL